MPLVLVTPPSQEPLTVTQAVNIARAVDPADPTIPGFISAARAAVERYTHRALITQTWQYLRDGWPERHPAYIHHGYPQIRVPKPPFQSVVSFQYLDTFGEWQTL